MHKALDDPYAAPWAKVEAAVLGEPGSLDVATRAAIARGDDPEQLASLLDKVRRQAYRIVDRDVAGLDDDVALEAVLAAAIGAADERRRAALAALERA
jgi:hypothetical protein